MKARLSDEAIDQIVEVQADDNAAWTNPIFVARTEPVALSIPAGLAARAAFLARWHREADFADWITRIIQERVEFEEAAVLGIKRDLAAKHAHPDGR